MSINSKNILLTQSFGKESEYRRVILAILSAFIYCNKDKFKVVLFTDKPDFFTNWFKGLNVEYVLLSPEKVKVMRGEINFLHRMKIAMIEETFQSNPESEIFYFDSDTFFTDDPENTLKKVNENTSSMHLLEYPFIDIKDMPLPSGETFQAYYKLITSNEFELVNGSKINVKSTDASWNAGVMCFHRSHIKFIPDVYGLTNQFYPSTKNHASEQYAFSVILQKFTNLFSCEEIVYHYWHRIKKQIIDLLLIKSDFLKLESLSLEEKLLHLKPFIQGLPITFDNHYLTLLDNSVQALNENKIGLGYKFFFKAFVKKPFLALNMLKDVIYHTKRFLLN